MKIHAADKALEILRAAALGYPEAYEDHPWGDTVYKVKGKIFAFLSATDGTFGISVKLPLSSSVALLLPFTEPTGYGLGKAGWVSARFPPKAHIPLDMLAAWLDESYRAIAPKKLSAALVPAPSAPAPSEPAPKKPPPAKKALPSAKKSATPRR